MSSTFADKSGRGILLAALNRAAAAQGYSFTADDLQFGAVEESTNPARESQVSYAATPNSRYEGEQVAYYNRLDLSEIFTRGGVDVVQVYAGPTTVAEVVAAVNQRFSLGFTEDDIDFSGEFEEGASVVTLVANPASHGYQGTVAVELVEGKVPLAEVVLDPILDGPDYPEALPAYVITPFIIEGELTVKGQKPDGTMLNGSGNPSGDMTVASNGEIELAVGARVWKSKDTIAPESGHYEIEIGQDGDWNWPFSVALLEEDRPVTDLYDVTLTATSVETGSTLEFNLSRDGEGVYHFADTEHDLDIVDSVQTESGSVVQNIQRMTFYKDQLGEMTLNHLGTPIGEFMIGLSARRRDGLAEVVEVSITVNVTVPQD